MALSLLLASGPALARDKVPSPGTPFAAIPSHLKTTTTTEQKAVRPLLIFQIGPGGSFANTDHVTIDGKKVKASRWEIAQMLLLRYTKKYGNKIQWALYIDTEGVGAHHLNSCKRKGSCGQAMESMLDFYMSNYPDSFQPDLPYARWYSSVRLTNEHIRRGGFHNAATGVWGDYSMFAQKLSSVKKAASKDFRPLTINYVVQPVYLHRANIRYRCQPSFYVVVDDGFIQEANRSSMGTSENAIFGMFELARNGDNPYPWRKMRIRTFKDKANKTFWPWDKPVVPVRNYDYACITELKGDKTGLWKTADENKYADGTCGMRFFSKTLATTDLMRTDRLPAERKTDDAGKSWDDPKFPVQSLNTFTIRINNSYMGYYDDWANTISAEQSYFRMRGMASKDEYFYNVTNGEQLKNAFDSIISTVEKSIKYGKVTSYSTVSPALGAPEMTPVPGSAANVRLNMFEGSSEIRFHDVSYDKDEDKIKDMKGDKAELDEAAAYSIKVDLKKYKLPLFSERAPLFHYKGEDHASSRLDRTDLGNDDFAIPGDPNFYRNEWKDSLLKWITRTAPDQEIHDRANNQLLYRVREKDAEFDNRSMGDIIDTPVLDIGDYLATAANDGMVYVFKKTLVGNQSEFSLKLNYLPMDVTREDDDDTIMKHYRLLADPEYAQSPEKPHQYMINGGLTWRLTAPSANGSRNLIVAGAFGQGGRGAYALRIAGNELDGDAPVGIESAQGVWNRQVPLFVIDAKKHDRLGYTFGDPQIGNVAIKRKTTYEKTGFVSEFDEDEWRYAMFLSSGFNDPQRGVTDTESALHVFNLLERDFGGDKANKIDEPGKLLKKIVADGFGGGLAQSTLVDLDNDGIVDVAYAGDYNGNLYRFDFKHGLDKAAAVKIFRAPFGQHFTSAPGVMMIPDKDPDTNKPIRGARVMVVIGTGSDIYEGDGQDKSRNAVYGIRDDLRDANPSRPLVIGDLQEQTFSEGGSAKDARGVFVKTRLGSSNKNDAARGWYMNLSEGTGERVVTKPIVYDGMALVTTRMYDSKMESSTANQNHGPEDPCVSSESTQKFSGKGWIMQFDALTGGMPKDFDFKTDESQSAYIDFLNHLGDSKNPIVTGVMEPGSGIPNLTMSGDKAVAENAGIMKGETSNKRLQLDANFEGDLGGSGVSGAVPRLSKKKSTDVQSYNLSSMKYERSKIVPALFVSTSIKGLQDPFTLAIKRIPEPKAPPEPAGQAQILKRISFKVLSF